MTHVSVSRDSHRLRVARTVAGAVRHDLANAAQLVLMAEATLAAVDGIPRDLPEALRAALRKIELQINRLERAHAPDDQPERSLDLASVFEPAVALYNSRPPGRNLRIHGEFPAEPPLPHGRASAALIFEAVCAVLDLIEQRAMAQPEPQTLFMHTSHSEDGIEVGFTGSGQLLGPIVDHDSADDAAELYRDVRATLATRGVVLETTRDSRDAMTVRFLVPADQLSD